MFTAVTILPRVSSLLAIAIAGVLIAGCGESEEEKAKAQVCHSREQINKSVTSLQTLPINASVVETAKKDLSAIESELGKIREAEPKLEPSIKSEVETAQNTFKTEIVSIAAAAAKELANGGLTEPQKFAPELKAALDKLVGSYKTTIGNIKC
jgi:predicted  nucleic acid-binding Zn-ribbon protein